MEKGKLKKHNRVTEDLLYHVDDIPATWKTIIYSFQWLIFSLTVCAVIPILVGTSLGLDKEAISAFILRTFCFSGLLSIIQVYFGHKLPIFEGPGGMWYNVLIVLGVMTTQLGKSFEELRANIVMGTIIVGIVYIVLGIFGLVKKIMPLFTPTVKGIFFLLMGLQISSSIVKGMLGIWPHGTQVNLPGLSVFFLVVIISITVSLKAKGFFQSIAIFIGTVVGWVAAAMLGIAAPLEKGSISFELPQFLPWGNPEFDLGITIILLITGFFTLSNVVASVMTMSILLDRKDTEKIYNSTTTITGFGNVLAGFFALIGFVPFASSLGFARITRVAAKLPFVISAIILIVLGLVPAVGVFIASIPIQVGYAVVLIMFCQIITVAFDEFKKVEFDKRNSYITGVSVLIGVGIMFIPLDTFKEMPILIRSFAGNGLIVGLLLCLLLEQVLIRHPK